MEGQNLLKNEYSKNIILNYFFKVLSIIGGLVAVNLYLTYLGQSMYGLWVTISSIASWAAVGDLGIGNGLRNELTTAYAKGDLQRQRELSEAAVTMLARLSVCLFLILTVISEILFVLGIMDSSLRPPMYICNFFMCVNFLLGVSKSIGYAYQESWMVSMSQFSNILFGLAGIGFLYVFRVSASLILFAFVNGFAGVFSNIILIVQLKRKFKIGFTGAYKKKKEHRNRILSVGIKFFILQISGLILYSTDSVIINRIIGSGAVIEYSIITKVYETGNTLFSIVPISFWSAVTFQYSRGNYKWVIHEIKKITGLWGGFSAGVIIVSFLLNPIIQIWLKENAIIYSPSLIILFALYTIVTSWGSIYVNVANGIGEINLQVICSVIGAVINIPLSVILSKSMGIFGIKLATLLCCFGGILVVPIQMIIQLHGKKN